MKKKLVQWMLFAILITSCISCGRESNQSVGKKYGKSEQIITSAQNETEEEKSEAVGESEKEEEIYRLEEPFKQSATEFGLTLFQNCYAENENVMISPLSVMAALSMTANGADGTTLSQMEDVLGQGTDMEELNQNLSAYINTLPSGQDARVSVANSIWFTDDDKLSVQQDFLDLNQKTYRAEIYKTTFDAQTVKDINHWVSDNTDEMIKNILDKVPEDAIMYLVNAVAFDARWQEQYQEPEVWDRTFTTETGKESQIPMMHSDEYRYIEDKKATGFCKPYKEGYSFVAILPNEGVTMKEYVQSLDSDSFRKMLNEEQDVKVHTAIPKFSTEYEIEMKNILMTMGMTDAFDMEKADFAKLGNCQDGNILINRVLHKTCIKVDENGTKAGAATIVEMMETTAMLEEQETKTVVLDRPFVYAIIDNENQLPVFIGSVMDI